MKPLVIDTFCKAGGAARGYARAGFDVIGIDIEPQPNYPFPFVQGDALERFPEVLAVSLAVGRKVLAHGSPPCQFATAGNRTLRAQGRSTHLNLVPQTRAMFQAAGVPYVIENVEAAREHLIDPVLLCGRHFGRGAYDTDGEWLTLDRHRLFETSWHAVAPDSCRPHKRVQVAGLYGGARRDKHEARHVRHGGYVPRSLDVLADLLGVPRGSMTEYEMFEAIPPDYTAYFGNDSDLLALLGVAA
jgi:DNA (cytosine-5)-methyltransferase 1